MNRAAMKNLAPIAMISHATILSKRSWCCCNVLPIPVAPQSEQDEDHRETGMAWRLGTIYVAPIRPLEVSRGDPSDSER